MADFAAVIELSTLSGTDGFQVNGEAADDRSGHSVASAGDVNGDGYDDFIIGAYYASPNGVYSGSSYVVFGGAGGFPANFELSSLNGTNGFKLNGEATYDSAGISVSSAGDLNGDGYDDLIIGATSGAYNAGAAYVVFGKASGFAATIELSGLNGTNGFQITGQGTFSAFGATVASAGDVNGDGYDDVIVGARSSDLAGTDYGAAYVVFGAAGGFSANLNASSLDGTNGFRILGLASEDHLGYTLASAGDVNGDGIGDIIIGASGADGGAYDGASYVIFGKTSGFTADFDLSDLDGTNGFKLSGPAAVGEIAAHAASAGDINGDGYDDLIIGATEADSNGTSSGSTYVVFGKASGFSADIDLGSLDGSNGFKINGEVDNDRSGVSVASAGDVNGDGYDDIIIGARGADPNGGESGASYVVFGGASGFAATIELSSLDGTNGFKINGEGLHDYSGTSVASAGDINHDGVDDLIIGAPRANPNGGDSGASYIILGHTTGLALDGTAGGETLTGSALGDTLNGLDGGDKLYGLAGVDTLNGGDGADRLYGGTHDDILNGGAGNDLLDGGPGADEMTGGTGNDVYYVDNAGDTTTENPGEGYDIVRASLTWTLDDNIEGLQLRGVGDIDGTGNALANNIVGNT
ncbi:MAG: FG-GAP repeat protein, partial [Caulobacter sp.]|nr:FG-GAP repeat protein [Caulobacter sp.]